MQRASRRSYHFLYRTVCITTGRHYIGMHSTDKIDDGYLGSGRWLRNSVEKYGAASHKREILQFFKSREELRIAERSRIDEIFLRDPLTMNLHLGGDGGWNRDVQKRNNLRSQARQSELRNNPLWKQRKAARVAAANRLRYSSGQLAFGGNQAEAFRGRKHTDTVKSAIGAKNSLSQRGTGNSQYGTCWVSKNAECLKVKLADVQKFLDLGYKRGRK